MWVNKMKEILKNIKLGQIIGIYHFEDSCFTVGKILKINSKYLFLLSYDINFKEEGIKVFLIASIKRIILKSDYIQNLEKNQKKIFKFNSEDKDLFQELIKNKTELSIDLADGSIENVYLTERDKNYFSFQMLDDSKNAVSEEVITENYLKRIKIYNPVEREEYKNFKIITIIDNKESMAYNLFYYENYLIFSEKEEFYDISKINIISKNRIENISDIEIKLDIKKENFYKILQENNFFNIRSWIYNNYKEEWGYIYKEKVSSDFEKYYKEKLDDKSQENSQLSISEFIGYNNKKYIPGSSIKGALRTAFIYSDFLENEKKYEIKSSYEIKNGKRVYNRKEGEKLRIEPKKDPFKTVKIFDTEEIELEKFSVNILQIKEGNLFCEVLGGMYKKIDNIEKINFGNEIDFKQGINFNIVLTEYYLKNNFKMEYKKNLGIKKLLDSLDDKIENILNFEIEKEREKDSYNLRNFYEFLKKIFNSFKNKNISLVRIGKYTGFNDKTINLLTTNPSENSRTILDENNYPMGWVLIKVEEVDI